MVKQLEMSARSSTLGINKASILIVDDDNTNRQIIQTMLQSAGFCNFSHADSADSAFAVIEKQRPNLILLDVIMPGISGFDFCRQLKKIKTFKQIPIIFLSALDGTDVRTKAFSLGGVDYINKPFNRQELIARSIVHVTNGIMMQQLELYNNNIRQELARAEHFQLSLLPNTKTIQRIEEKYEISLASAFIPSSKLAGDYWSALPIDNNRFAVLLCDFSGHGVGAALETVRFHGMLYEMQELWGEPEVLFSALNKKLFEMLEPESFATYQYALFDKAANTISISGAGTPPALKMNSKNKEFEWLECNGTPLGVVSKRPDTSQSVTIKLKKGDAISFYSDALSDAPFKDSASNILSNANIEKIMAIDKATPELINKHILGDYHAAPAIVHNDDLTLVTIQF